MAVAVDQRCLALVEERADVTVPVDVEVAKLLELGGHVTAELVERRLHERRPARHPSLGSGAAAGAEGVPAQPVELSTPVRAVELGQLVDEGHRDVEHVGIVRLREAATARGQILEHHDEGRVVRVVPGAEHLGDADRQLVAHGRVELCLGHAHPHHANEFPLLGDEGLEFDEERLGERRVACHADADADAACRAGVRVEDVDPFHASIQRLAEPVRSQVLHRGGNVHGHVYHGHSMESPGMAIASESAS